MPLLLPDQRTDEWRAAHRGRITASIAAACLGLSPWMSRQKAWRSILGTDRDKPNKHMAWGNEFEPQAKSAYEVETGNLIAETGFWVHPELDWLGASPDGLVGEDGLVEVKCPSKLPTSIPEHYAVQMRVQMAVCGRAWCDFLAWSQEGYFLARLERDLEAEVNLIWLLGDFHDDYVLTNTEPPRKRKGVA